MYHQTLKKQFRRSFDYPKKKKKSNIHLFCFKIHQSYILSHTHISL